MIEIIIPAYNCAKTLSRTLASLSAQTSTDFSVHVIDDCSSEDLKPIIDIYMNLLDIRVTRNKHNLGCGMSRQVGIDSTSADYIAFLDSDDVLLPYAVETWRYMSDAAPEADVFHSYFYEQTKNEDGAPVIATIQNGFTWCHGKLYKVDFLRKYDIGESPEVKYADDSYLNSQCTELGALAVIPFPMYMWINNSESVTRNPNGAFQRGKDVLDDFVRAMRLSTEKILQYKNDIGHLQYTLSIIEANKDLLNNSLKDYEYLKEVIKCH